MSHVVHTVMYSGSNVMCCRGNVMTQNKLSMKREKEKKTVRLMIGLYCRGNHKPMNGMLCDECQKLADYAEERADHCVHMEDKTFCSSCRSHCYKPEMRERIRCVMRYSGPRMIYHHPVMAVSHLIDTIRDKKKTEERS